MQHIYIAEINGAWTKTLPTFYRKIAERLKFPKTFGENLDALADCLSDLTWIEQKHVQLVLKNPEDLLSSEESELRETIFQIFNEAMEFPIEEDRTFEVIGERDGSGQIF